MLAKRPGVTLNTTSIAIAVRLIAPMPLAFQV